MATVVGVDAAKSPGWVAVTLQDGRLLSMMLHSSLQAVLDANPDASVFAVDIPIGHEDPLGTVDQGRRRCDRAAREFLGPSRQSSVFWVPPPSVFASADQTEAVAMCRSKGWIAPSAQLWALKNRILEAQKVADDERIHEVHPEVSFQALLHDQGKVGHLQDPKTTWPGLVERLELLHAAKLRPERSVGGVGRASPDDVLDATISAWTALRIRDDRARSLPTAVVDDPSSGRRVAIWY